MTDYDPNLLFDLVDEVRDEESFLDFLKALAADYAQEQKLLSEQLQEPYSAGPLGWENRNFPSICESAVAWAKDSPAHVEQDGAIWRRCA